VSAKQRQGEYIYYSENAFRDNYLLLQSIERIFSDEGFNSRIFEERVSMIPDENHGYLKNMLHTWELIKNKWKLIYFLEYIDLDDFSDVPIMVVGIRLTQESGEGMLELSCIDEFWKMSTKKFFGEHGNIFEEYFEVDLEALEENDNDGDLNELEVWRLLKKCAQLLRS